MTPLDFAQTLAKSDDPQEQALGVAILYRGLIDEDPSDPLRKPWPETNETIERAASYLGVDITPDLRNTVRDLAPTVSDAMLNKGAAAR